MSEYIRVAVTRILSEYYIENKDYHRLFFISILRKWCLHFGEKQSRVHVFGPHCSMVFNTQTYNHSVWIEYERSLHMIE